MDIKLPDSTLRKYLDTKATAEKIAEALTLCGPSVDRLHQLENDYVYEIEAITNRVDTASAFGVAREAAAILPLFGIKAVLQNNPYEIKASQLPERTSTKLPLEVVIKNESLIPRFSAIVLDQLTVKDSPKQIQHELDLSGIRPINNLVDVTNYLTLCFGQPVHIFDYDKISSHKMILRESEVGETITTLDERTHKLQGGDIIIEDGDGNLIDLCGIMGGKLSEVDENTTRAILFVQTYSPKKIRRTSLYTQERTLAAQIFEKQPDSKLVIPTLIEGVQLLQKNAGAKVASDSIDLYFEKPVSKKVKLDLKWLNQLIGYKFAYQTVSAILKQLGFKVKRLSTQSLEAEVPTWRLHDINIPEDLAEEVSRVYGYFRLESELPTTSNLSVVTDPILNWEYQSKKYLSDIGFSEIFNYSLTSKELFQKADMSSEHSLTLTNPLAGEFELMRRSLIPSILMDLSDNSGKVEPPIRIFELSNIYLVDRHKLDRLPEERSILVMATVGVDYRQSKGNLEALLDHLHLPNISFNRLVETAGPWLINQTAEVYSDKHFLGIFGAIKPRVKSAFGLKGDVYLVNLDFQTVANLANTNLTYVPVSAFPDVVEDVTIKSDKPVGALLQLIKQQNTLITSVFYKLSHKDRHTFRIHFNDSKKNLTQEEVNKIKTTILKIN